MDVHCFLLTDILLVCKQTVKKGHGNLKVRKFVFTRFLNIETEKVRTCLMDWKKHHKNFDSHDDNKFSFSQKVIRQPFLTDRLVVRLKEKENILHCVYLNEFNLVISAFVLQCNEAKNWNDGINKARHIYSKLKQDVEEQSIRILSQQQGFVNNYSVTDSMSNKKSPLGSSIGN